MNLAEVATGEYWYGQQALAKKLIDKIQTSDDYILNKIKTHQVIKISFEKKPTLSDKLTGALSQAFEMAFSRLVQKNTQLP